jgi:hypothetical protein
MGEGPNKPRRKPKSESTPGAGVDPVSLPSGATAAPAPTLSLPESAEVDQLLSAMEEDEQWGRVMSRDRSIVARERIQARCMANRSTSRRLEVAQSRERIAYALLLKQSNDRVEELGGKDGGVVRSDSAPPFRVPAGSATH